MFATGWSTAHSPAQIFLLIGPVKSKSVSRTEFTPPSTEQVLADQERCRPRSRDDTEHRDVRAMGIIAMILMQGYANEDGSVDDRERWSLDAVNFVSQALSVTSINKLAQVSEVDTFFPTY